MIQVSFHVPFLVGMMTSVSVINSLSNVLVSFLFFSLLFFPHFLFDYYSVFVFEIILQFLCGCAMSVCIQLYKGCYVDVKCCMYCTQIDGDDMMVSFSLLGRILEECLFSHSLFFFFFKWRLAHTH